MYRGPGCMFLDREVVDILCFTCRGPFHKMKLLVDIYAVAYGK